MKVDPGPDLRGMLPGVLPEVFWRVRWKWRKVPCDLLEDALQDAVMVVLAMKDPPRSATRLEATLNVVAKRNVSAALRRRSHGLERPQPSPEPVSDPDWLEKQVYVRELIVMIRSSPLTVRTRGAFLRLLSGETVAEIAVALKLKKNYVLQKIYGARTWVRSQV